MALKIQAIRGMNDLLPEDTSIWQQVESVLRQTVASYGYNRESPLAGRFGGNLAGMAAIAGFGNGEIIEALVYHALYNLWHPGFARRA